MKLLIIAMIFFTSFAFAKAKPTSAIYVEDFPRRPFIVVTKEDIGKFLVCTHPKSRQEVLTQILPQMFNEQVVELEVTCADGQLWKSPASKK